MAIPANNELKISKNSLSLRSAPSLEGWPGNVRHVYSESLTVHTTPKIACGAWYFGLDASCFFSPSNHVTSPTRGYAQDRGLVRHMSQIRPLVSKKKQTSPKRAIDEWLEALGERAQHGRAASPKVRSPKVRSPKSRA